MTLIYKDDISALFRCPECDFKWRICEVKGCKLQALREVWIKVRDSLGIPLPGTAKVIGRLLESGLIRENLHDQDRFYTSVERE